MSLIFFSSNQKSPLAEAEREHEIQRWGSKGGEGGSRGQAPGPCCCLCHPATNRSGEDETVSVWETCLWHGPQREGRQWPDTWQKGWLLWAAWRDWAGKLFYGQVGHSRLDKRSEFMTYLSGFISFMHFCFCFPSASNQILIITDKYCFKTQSCRPLWPNLLFLLVKLSNEHFIHPAACSFLCV